MKSLYLIDGMPLVYRGHFAFIRDPRLTSDGRNVSAVYGYVGSLLQILIDEKPTHVAVAFDTPEPTRRHREFPAYKAQREAIPEDIIRAIPQAIEITEALKIPVLRVPGFEADDVIGTLARQAAAAGMPTVMVTPDKDFSQLVSDHVMLCRPGRGGGSPEVLGVPEVLAKWGIERIDQVVEIMGLMGDASDNIPGIKGVGEKTAQKLIAKFGTIENLLAHTDQLKGKQKERVIEHADDARLSRKLVIIDTDVPLDHAIDDLARRAPDLGRVRELFAGLEFKSLLPRLLKLADVAVDGDAAAPAGGVATAGSSSPLSPRSEPPIPPCSVAEQDRAPPGETLRTLAGVPHDYRIAASQADRKKLIDELKKARRFCFDSETTGLNKKTAGIVGFAFSLELHTGVYVPFPSDPEEARAILDEFRPVFEREDAEIVGHNLKFDLSVLHWHGVEVRARVYDTMLASQLTAPGQRHGMDALAERHLGYAPVKIETLIGEKGGEKGKDQKSIGEAPVDQVAEYAVEDADITLQLAEKLAPILKEKNAERIFAEIECPLVPVLVSMEAEGVRVDVGALETYSEELGREAEALEARIYELAGEPFNLNSPKQLGEIFFDKLGLVRKPRKTRTGQYATNEQVLQSLAPKHEIVQAVLDYRGVSKLKSTYVDTLPGTVFKPTGRIHTTYNQAVTATGRMQSSGPNLQNIPIRSERGREIRKTFVPRDGDHVLLAADYSQIELRVMAELSGDEGLRDAFQRGADIHTETAARVYGVMPDLVSDEMRRSAKMVNFGIIYGISPFGLAQRLGIGRAEASEIIVSYFQTYPGVKDYMDRTIARCRETGYVETLLGRRRYIRDIDSQNATTRGAAERIAINAPIQGTAADMIKIAMVRVFGRVREAGLASRMILQVHDELVFDARRDEIDALKPIIEQCMTTAIPMTVPIVVELGTGENWLEAH